MRKFFRFFFFTLATLVIFCVLLLGGFLLFTSIKDYKPASIENIAVRDMVHPDTIPAGRLNFLTWNIGYCGLGAEMDFFYEDGKQVMPDKTRYRKYFSGVSHFLKNHADSLDFMLLQEVDRYSKRSWYNNQADELKKAFRNFTAFFACNYKVPFVPVPLRSPMGKVDAGLLSLSRFRPCEAKRINYHSGYSWPKKLFMLDRCILLVKYPLKNGKQLIIINLHNSAFNDATELRSKELRLLKEILVKEYGKGNYVIAGGDWNQNPVPFEPDKIVDGNRVKIIEPKIPAGFLPADFHWAFDPAHPTNRDVDKPFHKGFSPTTILDFFVVSDNISIEKVTTLSNDFAFSDHQPVRLTVMLK